MSFVDNIARRMLNAVNEIVSGEERERRLVRSFAEEIVRVCEYARKDYTAQGVGLARAVKRRNQLEKENKRLLAERGRFVEALAWASGSPSFQREGEARIGWLKLCAPLLPGYVEANALEELAAHESAAVQVVAIEEDVTRAPADHAAIYPPPIEYDLDEIDNGPVF